MPSVLKSLVRAFAAVPAAELEEAEEDVEEPPSLERRLLAALVAADVPSEFKSSPEIDFKVLSTLEELLLFTRFLEPEIRPERNDLTLVFCARPWMFVASDTRLLMLLALFRSNFPSALYWV